MTKPMSEERLAEIIGKTSIVQRDQCDLLRELTRLRNQLQEANEVVDALELAQLATEQDREGSQMWVQCWNKLTAYRATQKGGE